MGISVQQLLIVLAIIILLFGAKKIPELAKGMGKGIKSFKKEMERDDDDDDETTQKVEKVEKKTQDAVDVTVEETTKKA